MRTHPAELIKRKRDGGALTAQEIGDLVGGVTDGSLGPEQLGAWLMAICIRGMSIAETSALTLAMRDSGTVVDLSGLAGAKVDKHSTGGVGDKVSLLLAPLVAAAGVWVPMISGRGLGHTGGTIDKLQAIPGYRTDLSLAEFRAVLEECGFVMAGASREIAPADQRMYAARDVSGTVESIPLITASILSKKLAEGIDGLVMDVKWGRAAFMREIERARALTKSLVDTGRAAGIDVHALLTNMDTPLGLAIGNALEVREVVACLRGAGPSDLLELTLALGAEMLVLAGAAKTPDEAQPRLAALLRSGAAADRLRRNVERQGGDPRFLDDPEALGEAPVRRELRATAAGHVADIDPLALGICVRNLGGGRRQPADRIDPRVGIVLGRRLGEPVARGDLLATVHAADDAAAGRALEAARRAIVVGAPPRTRALLIADRLA
jgi:pyrimidine-nucleoside phosphorylase